MLKRTFYASGTILMLAIAWQLLTSNASGQTTPGGRPAPKIVGASVIPNDDTPILYVVTENGDVYARSIFLGKALSPSGAPPMAPAKLGNFWEGPTPH